MRIGLDALEAWVITFLDHRPTEGWVVSEAALRLARAAAKEAGGAELLGPTERHAYLEAVQAAWLAALQADRIDGMRELSDELFAASRGFDETAGIEALTLSGVTSRAELRFREAEAAFRRAWTLAHERVLPRIIINAGHWLALTLHDLGDLEEGASVAAEVAALVTRVGDYSQVRSRSRTAGHVIALTSGAWREGIDGLVATAAGEPDPHARLVGPPGDRRPPGSRRRRATPRRDRHPPDGRPSLGRAGGLPTLPPRARSDVGRGPGAILDAATSLAPC